MYSYRPRYHAFFADGGSCSFKDIVKYDIDV